MKTEDAIYSFAAKHSLAVGIGPARCFEYLRPVLAEKKVPFSQKDIEKRINPALSYPDVRSVICLGMSYNKEFTGRRDNLPRGIMSLGAVGEDYHILLAKHLYALMDCTGIEGKIFVDTGPLVDREVAVSCGIGNYGNNCSVISAQLGAMFFIGYILTSSLLEPTGIIKERVCIGCNRCISACPTGALNKKGFDFEKCISYITQLKGCLTDKQMSDMGLNIYGCDICQRVCPLNAPPEKIDDREAFFPDIEKLLNMSNREFAQTYGKTAAGWRGKKTLQRNALIALGNMRDISTLQIVLPFTNDKREDISYAAKWAYNRIKE